MFTGLVMTMLFAKSRLAQLQVVALCAVMALTSSVSVAQLSSPIAGGVPMGSGPGVHSPSSQFPPLPERADVLPWSLLSDVKVSLVKKRVLAAFAPAVQALDGKVQRVQGFMMPLTRPFCLPGGPESMVEVKTQTPVKYTVEPVLVEGTLAALADDPMGLYYRILDGKVAR